MAEQDPTKKADDTASDPSSDKKNEPVQNPKDSDAGGKEPMIPKHRLDEESQKRQDAEKRAEAAEKAAQEAVASSKAVETRLADLASALAGGDKTQREVDKEVADLAAKYDVKPEFFNDLLAVAEKRAMRKLEPSLKQAQTHNEEAGFKDELEKLADEIPEVADLSAEDKAELKKRAFSKEFLNAPLKSVYRDMMYDKPRGKQRTAESGRGGGRAPSDGEVKLDQFDMTTPEGIAAFEKYSNDLGRRA